MDPSTLSSSLDLVASACGQTLAVDHKAAVETSLALLKKVCPENNPALEFTGLTQNLGQL
jgi:hypothetical protein